MQISKKKLEKLKKLVIQKTSGSKFWALESFFHYPQIKENLEDKNKTQEKSGNCIYIN